MHRGFGAPTRGMWAGGVSRTTQRLFFNANSAEKMIALDLHFLPPPPSPSLMARRRPMAVQCWCTAHSWRLEALEGSLSVGHFEKVIISTMIHGGGWN